MARIYMIRHGKPASTWAQEGDPDPGLDEQGRRQAEAAADLLMALPDGERPVRVVSSPLRRCRETAQAFADRIGATVEIDPRVGEIPTPKALGNAGRGAWLNQAFRLRWDQIEGDLNYDAWRRAVAEGLTTRSGTAVFSHFVALNAAVSCVTGDDRVLSFRPDHASVTVFDVTEGRLRLIERGREAATQVL